MAQSVDGDTSMRDADDALVESVAKTQTENAEDGREKDSKAEMSVDQEESAMNNGKDAVKEATSAAAGASVKDAADRASQKESTPLAGRAYSTAPSKEVAERYAPGSAPFWLGMSGNSAAAAAALASSSAAGQDEASSTAPDEASTDSSVVKKEQDDQEAGDAATGTKADTLAAQQASSSSSKYSVASLSRSLPVKRYDGEALTRADLQHNVLTCIFADNHRVFRNPRAGPTGPPGSVTWRTPVPAYPPGNAREATRRSDETPEEFKKYDEERKAFEDVPFDDTKGKKEDERDGIDLPDTLRPRKGGLPRPGNDLLTFKELYIEQLLHSAKCTKAMRDKLVADEVFAEDFAKVCLLVNVGRINTTLAFYPEMKTILRSYHPLPSMQRTENTRRNLQDAPRMKSLLKSVMLDDEKGGPPPSTAGNTRSAKSSAGSGDRNDAPSSMADLVRKLRQNTDTPPTSAVNLLFILITHNSEITTMHFEHPHDFFTIFFPHPEVAVPSAQRARVFLWLMWHYLEGGVLLPPGSKENPFDDDTSRQSAKEAREAWDSLTSAEQDKIKARGYWKGTKNPAYAEARKRRSERSTAQQEKATEGESSGSATNEVMPPEYLHRVLCPKLDSISFQESAKENVDSAEELEFAEQMKEERRQFLVRFQEEEQAKAAEGRSTPMGADTSIDGRRAGSISGAKGKGKDKGGKKRASHVGGGSSYPLANILAAANAEKAAAAAAAASNSAEGDSRKSKRARRDGSNAVNDGSDDDDEEGGFDKADTLWDLDLSLPPHLAPQHGLLRARGAAAAASAQASDPHAQSLPRIAWRRILERAQRGVGDASYESDDEEVARDEAARDERPRAEMARILACLRDVRTHRGNIMRPVVTAAAAPTTSASRTRE